MVRISGGAFIFVLACAAAAHADGKYTITKVKSAPPKEIKEPIRQLLAEHAARLQDDKGGLVGEVWFRKEIPAKATAEQVKNGLTYREIEEGTLFGAVRFDRLMTDYRKQKIMPGVYTLRLGFQPMDGDHMGTAPTSDFFLVIPAAVDMKPEAPEAKQLREDSARAVKTSHPGVLLLFPNTKPDGSLRLAVKENDHWVLNYAAPVVVDGKKSMLGVGLTVVGHSTLE